MFSLTILPVKVRESMFSSIKRIMFLNVVVSIVICNTKLSFGLSYAKDAVANKSAAMSVVVFLMLIFIF